LLLLSSFQKEEIGSEAFRNLPKLTKLTSEKTGLLVLTKRCLGPDPMLPGMFFFKKEENQSKIIRRKKLTNK